MELEASSFVGFKRAPLKNQSLQIIKGRGIPIGTVLDVGVLNGTPELMAAFPDKPHILFEPLSEYVDAITNAYSAANISFNLISAAVSDREGDVHLQARRQTNEHVSTSSVINAPQGPDMRVVRGITLDGFTDSKKLAEPYFLKIDVDGNEMLILKGAAETLKHCSVVMIEAPKGHIGERIGFLESHGFELFDLAAPCYYDDSFWQCDAILIRRDLHRAHFRDLATKLEISRYIEFNEASLR